MAALCRNRGLRDETNRPSADIETQGGEGRGAEKGDWQTHLRLWGTIIRTQQVHTISNGLLFRGKLFCLVIVLSNYNEISPLLVFKEMFNIFYVYFMWSCKGASI